MTDAGRAGRVHKASYPFVWVTHLFSAAHFEQGVICRLPSFLRHPCYSRLYNLPVLKRLHLVVRKGTATERLVETSCVTNISCRLE